jgi:hypothetical protein
VHGTFICSSAVGIQPKAGRRNPARCFFRAFFVRRLAHAPAQFVVARYVPPPGMTAILDEPDDFHLNDFN